MNEWFKKEEKDLDNKIIELKELQKKPIIKKELFSSNYNISKYINKYNFIYEFFKNREKQEELDNTSTGYYQIDDGNINIKLYKKYYRKQQNYNRYLYLYFYERHSNGLILKQEIEIKLSFFFQSNIFYKYYDFEINESCFFEEYLSFKERFSYKFCLKKKTIDEIGYNKYYFNMEKNKIFLNDSFITGD